MAKTLLTVRAAQIRLETADTRSFRLVPEPGLFLPAFAAGSHIDVHLPNGLIRQYSLCNGPLDTDHYAIAVKRETSSRGGSAGMHDIAEGDLITISEPRNNFPLQSDAKQSLLLAGGIGITPMLSMARHLQAQAHPFQLHYFTRSIEHTAFQEELSGPAFAGRMHLHHEAEPDDVQRSLRPLLSHWPEGAHLYICGPLPFMSLVQATAQSAWPSAAVHLEYFTAGPPAPGGPGEAFDITLALTGGTWHVPEGQSIVDVLTANGVAVDVSCEQGICGTCLTGVLDGEPDHRDMFLTDEEKASGGKMLICVSRARSSRLLLDL